MDSDAAGLKAGETTDLSKYFILFGVVAFVVMGAMLTCFSSSNKPTQCMDSADDLIREEEERQRAEEEKNAPKEKAPKQKKKKNKKNKAQEPTEDEIETSLQKISKIFHIGVRFGLDI